MRLTRCNGSERLVMSLACAVRSPREECLPACPALPCLPVNMSLFCQTWESVSRLARTQTLKWRYGDRTL
ncbi:hypothetical protein E2C01_005615 [Portunus trituberculatus]|uniref:Uncharacterized protein n=1 Tax=Portunus trituberculatus TaxID=210409 RepID=A0A5B7CTY5_PORTR|nr:hypothetical protein [Portunus trituberculatus]